jgi:integrase
VRVEKPKQQAPKRCYTLGEAKAMIVATLSMPAPRSPQPRAIAPHRWWRAFLLVLFYTGLRIGTVLKLRRSMIERRGDQTWLVIPGEITKTGKALEKFLHPTAAKAIDQLGAGELIFPWRYWKRHLNNRHELLQRIAGISHKLSLHAWRRTHGTEMAKIGAAYGRRIAQQTLDHEDEETTSEFYVNIEAELIAKLPDIDCSLDDPRQGKLF